ncbi:hypothetical protein ABVT39_024009 [Epinephelus coioides]
MINVHRTTACRAIRRVSLALQRFVRNNIHLPTQEEAARTKQMTPLIAPRTAQEHNYNMKHASTRNIVEQCIRVLKRRFHCLHGEMRMHPERVCVVIAAAAVLHNICIKKRIPLLRQEDVVPEVDENPAPAIPEDISGRLARNHIINNL